MLDSPIGQQRTVEPAAYGIQEICYASFIFAINKKKQELLTEITHFTALNVINTEGYFHAMQTYP